MCNATLVKHCDPMKMSGGHFNYAYIKVHDFLTDLEDEIDHNHGEEGQGYGPNTMRNLMEVINDVRKAKEMMRLCELLYSGDIKEDTFVDEIVKLIN